MTCVFWSLSETNECRCVDTEDGSVSEVWGKLHLWQIWVKSTTRAVPLTNTHTHTSHLHVTRLAWVQTKTKCTDIGTSLWMWSHLTSFRSQHENLTTQASWCILITGHNCNSTHSCTIKTNPIYTALQMHAFKNLQHFSQQSYLYFFPTV